MWAPGRRCGLKTRGNRARLGAPVKLLVQLRCDRVHLLEAAPVSRPGCGRRSGCAAVALRWLWKPSQCFLTLQLADQPLQLLPLLPKTCPNRIRRKRAWCVRQEGSNVLLTNIRGIAAVLLWQQSAHARHLRAQCSE